MKTAYIMQKETKKVLRLNPNNVLPAALGEPLLLGIAFMFISFRRKKYKINNTCAY